MSAELVRHALELAQQDMLHNMRKIINEGHELDLILVLIDSGGGNMEIRWTDQAKPESKTEALIDICRTTKAAAALFIREFNEISTDRGYRVAGMHWCFPEDGVSENAFFTIDPDDHDMLQLEDFEIEIPDTLVGWLDWALVQSQVDHR